MRIILLMMVALGALAQDQQPRYQAGWPCTGKERAFDPSYSKIAEATGGHLFLFDKSEVAGTSVLAIGDMRHKETIVRASGKLESYVDIPVQWIPASTVFSWWRRCSACRLYFCTTRSDRA